MAAKPSTDRRLFWVPLPSSTADKSFEASEPTEVFPAASYLDVSSSPGGHYLREISLCHSPELLAECVIRSCYGA